ncbi:MAG: Mrp/NBP35 family ATP-binding protein [Peptococcaceae bacterium]|jgi:Mrp family chromosome partitioning ATPase|nr:Mrp/NBP35 family ATP-binding protein [Peptococcaceae bacterium]MDH7524013.1 Mrp/NBP35 family ATP-binding protein [Peptococcaceae bacterium]
MPECTGSCSSCEEKDQGRCTGEQQGKASGLNNVKHVIAVMSGKGGVGKSTVTALLAVAYRKRGYKVGILDADITGPSIPKLFGLSSAPPVTELGILPIRSRKGIEIISINLLLPSEDEPVIWRGPIISGAIKQFWEEVVWGDLDYLFVDLPPGTGDAPLTVMQTIPLNGVVVVTSPQDLAQMVVRKAVKMAEKMKVPLLGIVENMSYLECPACKQRVFPFGEGKAGLISQEFKFPVVGTLPLEPSVSSLGDEGRIEESPGADLLEIDFLTEQANKKQ